MAILRCPRCTYPLSIYTHGETELDHCRRCGGNFVEAGESTALLAPDAEPSKWKESFAAKSLGNTQIMCPKDGTVLEGFEVEFDDKKVEVDVCDKCHGMWLDKGEAATLQQIARAASEHAEGRASGTIKPGLGSYVFQVLTGFPIEAWNPVKKKPVVVYTLLVMLGVLFLFQMGARITAPEWVKTHYNLYMMVPLDVLNGTHLWTVLTCAFFHGGFMHIIGNAYFLYIFGDNVEDELGRKKFIVLYLIAGICGSLLHFAFNADSKIPLVGASGAIAGLMGAYLVLFPKVKMYVMIIVIRIRIGAIWYLGFWIAYQFVMLAAGGEGVAFLAHAGGFFAGAILGWMWKDAGVTHQPAMAT